MRTRRGLWDVVVLCWVLGPAGFVTAAPAYWTDWTSASPGSPDRVIGAIPVPGVGPVGVTYTGDYTFAGVNGSRPSYWNPGSAYADGAIVDNGPSLDDIIGLQGGGGTVHTLAFSQPVVNPTMALSRLGWRQPTMYSFDASFSTIARGPATFGHVPFAELISRILNMNGRTIQFQGTFSEIHWTTPQGRFWHGFTVGIGGVAPGPGLGGGAAVPVDALLDGIDTHLSGSGVGGQSDPGHLPAPGALLLGGIGAGLIGCLHRRRVL